MNDLACGECHFAVSTTGSASSCRTFHVHIVFCLASFAMGHSEVFSEGASSKQHVGLSSAVGHLSATRLPTCPKACDTFLAS